jgi:hypothetical protein
VGDGFHVGGWFIQHLPFDRSSFTPHQLTALQVLGGRLWDVVQAHRVVSLNKGRQTIAYRPLACEAERDAIDDILIHAARLPTRFRLTLKSFVRHAVIVDDTDARRGHLKLLFDAQEKP